MSTILYIIYENTETTPTTYYPEVYSRADIDIDQIASLINEAHQTIDVALIKVTLLEMAEVIKRELADGYWVSFDDFMTFQTGINAESTDTEIYLDEDDLQVIGYVYNAFTDAVEDAATFELLKYGFPRAPWILSAVDSKYGLVDHVVDNHGLTITGEDFVIDKSDTYQGVWIKSPAGNDYRQNKYTYVSSGTIIITAELSGEDGPAGKNSVEVELSIRASYDGGSTISTGTYENKIRRINQVSDAENKVFLKGSQTTCGVQILNTGYQQYEEVLIQAYMDGESINLSLYEGTTLKDTVNAIGNGYNLLSGTGTLQLKISDYNSFVANLTNGITETVRFNDEPFKINLLLDASDTSTITESGGYVSQWNDKSGRGNNATQSTGSLQPFFDTGSPQNIKFDLADDKLQVTVPTGGFSGTAIFCFEAGSYAAETELLSGVYNIGQFLPDKELIGVIIGNGVLPAEDIEDYIEYFISKGAGGTDGWGSLTSFQNAWRENNLTSFPAIDLSGGTNFSGSWRENSLTSFPAIDLSGGTTFYAAWYKNSLTSFPTIDLPNSTSFQNAWRENSLTSFPAIDLSSGTNFSYAWNNNNLTSFPANMFDYLISPSNYCFLNSFSDGGNFINSQGVENILVSIDTSGANAPASGVDITISSDGEALTSASVTAIASLKLKGWTITIDGVPR